MSPHLWRHRLATVGYWLVAWSFFVGMVTKFWPGPTMFGPAYAEKFADWGYPSWFRFVVGAIEGVCAVGLVIPRRRVRFLAAATLVLLLVGANTTHIISGSQVSERLAAPTMLLVSAVIALANWPSDWRDLLRPWQAPLPAAADATAQPTAFRPRVGPGDHQAQGSRH